jgi:hypothetical protein
MQEEARRVVVDVAKHLVTITVASISFLVTMMFTTFDGTPYMLSAQVSLFALLLCVVFSVLTQLAEVEDVLGAGEFYEMSEAPSENQIDDAGHDQQPDQEDDTDYPE